MARPDATSYRLGDEILRLIEELRPHLPPTPRGDPASASDVIRTAVRDLARRTLPGQKKNQK